MRTLSSRRVSDMKSRKASSVACLAVRKGRYGCKRSVTCAHSVKRKVLSAVSSQLLNVGRVPQITCECAVVASSAASASEGVCMDDVLLDSQDFDYGEVNSGF